jgi:iron complex outermembrane recepter protein
MDVLSQCLAIHAASLMNNKIIQGIMLNHSNLNENYDPVNGSVISGSNEISVLPTGYASYSTHFIAKEANKYRYYGVFGIFIMMLVLLLAVPVTSQAQSVSGIVRDATTRDPLPGASVRIQGTAFGTQSGVDGRFEWQLPQEAASRGSITLEVSYLGYRTEILNVRSADDRDLTILLLPGSVISDEIFVMGHRVDERTPVTYSNISRDDIDRQNSGKDIPFLLLQTPSVVSTSDAGGGVGYTGIRIRGVDDTRINVTINGIPLNDSESHGVFWVNLPDFASSVGNMQIQRGVGTSTNGPAAFGATLNLQTGALETDPYARVASTYGSFNTFRNTLQVGTGLLPNQWAVEGRLSAIQSDGFIDRATSDLSSWYVSASRYGSRDLLKINVFSGSERTYQAWNGVPEARLRNDRAGMLFYAENHGLSEAETQRLLGSDSRRYNMFTYEDQVDQYSQTHYQLHYSYRLQDNWYLNSALHYTRGEGYFEEFREGDRLSTYMIVQGSPRSDLVRRRWLDNHFYGGVVSTEYRSDRWTLTAGGGYNEYDGDHFGEVIWARTAPQLTIGDRYYDNNGFKTDLNTYAKLNIDLSERISAFGDLQLRRISYTFLGFDRNMNNVDQSVDLTFFNPKAGLVYLTGEGQRAYLSYSVGNKEPVRREYTRSTPGTRPRHETLFDLEAGYRVDRSGWNVGANFFWMDYNNQLILTGQLNDVGAAIRTNVKDSYRVGVELEGAVQLSNAFQWGGNLTLSRHRIPEFVEFVDDYDTGVQRRVLFEDTPIALSPELVGSSVFSYQHGRLQAGLISKGVGRQYLDNSGLSSRSIDPYLIHDLELGYDLGGIRGLSQAKLSIQLFNLLDTAYETNGYTYAWYWGGEEYRFNFYYPQAGRHFMLRMEIGF